jgi:hypothetical protein
MAPWISKSRGALSVNRHEEWPTLHSSSGRYRFGNATFAERLRPGQDAPKAVVCVSEEDFVGFSCVFRLGRSQLETPLDALIVGIRSRR